MKVRGCTLFPVGYPKCASAVSFNNVTLVDRLGSLAVTTRCTSRFKRQG